MEQTYNSMSMILNRQATTVTKGKWHIKIAMPRVLRLSLLFNNSKTFSRRRKTEYKDIFQKDKFKIWLSFRKLNKHNKKYLKG